MGAILYTNTKGFAVTRHSYSAGQDFKQCRRKYQLSRVKGWKEKVRKASKEFGNCIEAAIQFYHSNNLMAGSGVVEFKRLWKKWQAIDDLVYTDKEGDWSALHIMGSDMMALYEILLPSFGYTDPKFQLNYRKEVFPGTDLAGLEYSSFIDMHAKIGRAPEPGPVPIIIDIKTASTPIENAHLLMLDPQLREYAWVTGVPDVAFLNFVKASTTYKKGDLVTVLQTTNAGGTVFTRGAQAIVAKADELIGIIALADEAEFDKIEGRTKAAKEACYDFIQKKGAWVARGAITKVKIQFLKTHIDAQEQLETGQEIGQEIAEIVAANKAGSFPKRPGIRFPNNHCILCSMLPICSKDDKKRDATLVQIGAAPAVEPEPAKTIVLHEDGVVLGAPPQKDWIDELENS